MNELLAKLEAEQMAGWSTVSRWHARMDGGIVGPSAPHKIAIVPTTAMSKRDRDVHRYRTIHGAAADRRRYRLKKAS